MMRNSHRSPNRNLLLKKRDHRTITPQHISKAENDEERLEKLIKQIVPTFSPAGKNGSEKKGQTYRELMKEVREES